MNNEYTDCSDLIKRLKYNIKKNTNNNWRKLHGFPMLRRRNKINIFNLPRLNNPTLFIEVDNPEFVNKFYEKKEKNNET